MQVSLSQYNACFRVGQTLVFRRLSAGASRRTGQICPKIGLASLNPKRLAVVGADRSVPKQIRGSEFAGPPDRKRTVPDLANRTKITVGGTMRYLMVVPFLGALLCAQTPPALGPDQQSEKPPAAAVPGSPSADQAAEFWQSKPDQWGVSAAPGKNAAPPARAYRFIPSEQSPKPLKWKLFPFLKSPASTGSPRTLISNGGRAPLGFVNRNSSVHTVVRTQRPQPCAVPLTNVLRLSGASPTIRRVPVPDGLFPMIEVHPPAPSCDDRKP